jgi:7-carboxy-7-deazaguanine synthase
LKQYRINEIFYSVQGEGARAGSPSLFVRFSKCNLLCTVATHGFDCDTEFESGRDLTVDEIIGELAALSEDCNWIVLTGGEPALQVDEAIVEGLHAAGYFLAIETNGTVSLPEGLDWVTISPKVTENSLQQRVADEVKYVRSIGQGIPRSLVKAQHYLISPAFDGEYLDPETLEWCLDLVRRHPTWRLSVQQHKGWGVR